MFNAKQIGYRSWEDKLYTKIGFWNLYAFLGFRNYIPEVDCRIATWVFALVSKCELNMIFNSQLSESLEILGCNPWIDL